MRWPPDALVRRACLESGLRAGQVHFLYISPKTSSRKVAAARLRAMDLLLRAGLTVFLAAPWAGYSNVDSYYQILSNRRRRKQNRPRGGAIGAGSTEIRRSSGPDLRQRESMSNGGRVQAKSL